MNDDKISIVSEDGTEKEYAILLTFKSDEYNKDYVVFFEEGTEELFVSSYLADTDDGGKLEDITNDDEWQMIEEVIEAFLLEDEIENA